MDYSVTGSDVQPRVSSPAAPQAAEAAKPVRRSIPFAAVAIMQTIIFLGHVLLYVTWKSFWSLDRDITMPLGAVLLVLSLTFVTSTILGFRSTNAFIAVFYKLAAIWLGFLNFLVWAACLCWAADLFLRVTLPHASLEVRPWVALILFGIAVIVSLFGFVNARLIRERRVTVKLPNLPEAWRGRKAMLVSDIHLGNVNGAGFSRRILKIFRRLDPSIVFIAGDLYDGSVVDAERLARPLFEMKAPLGVYFSEGNHEDHGDAAGFCAALRDGGIRVLRSEVVDVEGVKIIGIPYADSVYPMHFATFMEGLQLDPSQPSILLNHVPNRLPITEKAGVSLQLSGHTHGGQVFPFTWFTQRAFGKFTYGLQRFGNLQVLTSSGAGTWGPPMRVGTAPEVILITFA
ncbi:metallophosphoesterase [Occallatibacter riparius]|uniref:Metallophosphoesterase n=1 Tax=Occallatibacter riparius TaxID=1002689 RepID=A0A9J7BVL1_9BACT|nr:metallophosphoesterase [Occallatibacter riparius]UWZ86672.1 metallophosphoesterase [Occallatibacter riparius]